MDAARLTPDPWLDVRIGDAREVPYSDPRTNVLTTYIRGWQGEQAIYTRAGRMWQQ